ncbi:MAG: hypothetical protein V7L02_09475 [Nostoc sp.]|uniref:hypothetical protein n=1 Tax=Nostoc sp. TaxID=1180 RepID=UPI002FF460DB
MNENLPQELDRESLNQLSKEELVEIIIEQGKIIHEWIISAHKSSLSINFFPLQ